RVDEHQAERVLLRQPFVGGGGERQVHDVAAVDIEADEGEIVGAALLRDRRAQEHAGPGQRDEQMVTLWRWRPKALRALRVAHARGAAWFLALGGGVGDRSRLAGPGPGHG